jgi:hypothetical protein
MTIAFENGNKPVTWADLVNYLADMHTSADVEKVKQDGSSDEVAHVLRNLKPCPGRES